MFRQLCAVRIHRAVHHVAALEHWPNFIFKRTELHTADIRKPLNLFAGFFNIHACKFCIAAAKRYFHHVVVEVLEGIFNTLLLLNVCISSVDNAAGVNRIAGRTAHLFKNNGACSNLLSFNSGSHTGAAAADDDNVINFFAAFVVRRISSSSRRDDSCGKHCRKACLYERPSREFVHFFSLDEISKSTNASSHEVPRTYIDDNQIQFTFLLFVVLRG